MRVLVVEDDAGIAGGLAASLRQAGYAVDVCGTLAAAWASLCVEPFDAVLLEPEPHWLKGAFDASEWLNI